MTLGQGADAYLPSSAASRATALSVIAGAHAVVLALVISMGGMAVVLDTVRPMKVEILPEPPQARPPASVRTVPLPQLRRPDIVVPEPPRFDVLQAIQVVEKPAPPPPPAPVSVAPQPEAPPAIEPPRFGLAYLDNPAPTYPVFAKRAREQGVVKLRVRVDAKGGVEGIAIEKSSGSQRLDEAALAAVRRWRFVPARQGDRAIAGTAIVPINFQLEG